MNSLDELIGKQIEIFEVIKTNVANYKKDNSNVKSKHEYYTRRIETHQQLIKQFELNHDIIKSFGQWTQSDYSKDNFIDNLRQSANKHMKTLSTKLQELGDLPSDTQQHMLDILAGFVDKPEDNRETIESKLSRIEQNHALLSEKYKREKDLNATLTKENDTFRDQLNRAKAQIGKLNEEKNNLTIRIGKLTEEKNNLTTQIENFSQSSNETAILERLQRLERSQLQMNSRNRRESLSGDDDHFTIQEILRMIPKYGGKREELRIYINKCDELWSHVAQGPQQVKFTSTLKNNLYDEAALILLDEEDLDSWEDIKDLLKRNFGIDPNHSNNLAMLQSIRQMSDESVDTFCKRIKDILTKIKSIIPNGTTKQFWFEHNERQAIQALEDGLKDANLQARIIAANKPTFNLAAQYAMEVDTRLRGKENLHEKPITKESLFCKYCKKKNHSIENCRLKKVNDHTNKDKRDNNKSDKELKKCEICDRANHKTADCYKNPKNKNNEKFEYKKKNVNKIAETTEDNRAQGSENGDGDSDNSLTRVRGNTIRIKKMNESNNEIWFEKN